MTDVSAGRAGPWPRSTTAWTMNSRPALAKNLSAPRPSLPMRTIKCLSPEWKAPCFPAACESSAGRLVTRYGTGCAGVRGHGRSHRYCAGYGFTLYLWERASPRSRRCGGWHRLRRCSRPRPLLQVQREPEARAVPVGAGKPAKQAMRWMAPALPVFAAKAAPTGTARARSLRRTCGSGFTREAGDAVDGTGCAGVRG